MHEHQHAPHDEFSPLDEFRVLLEERPEQADRVLRWARDMHEAVRTVLTRQQDMVEIDRVIFQGGPPIDATTTAVQLAAMFAVLQARQRLMGDTLNGMAEVLLDTIGCADPRCASAWTKFFDPPESMHPSGGFAGMVVVDGSGVARFIMGNDGFADEDGTPDGDAWDNGID